MVGWLRRPRGPVEAGGPAGGRGEAGGPPLTVRLYERPGCHLCEEALDNLTEVRRTLPLTLERCDITSRADWYERYRDRIPVVAAGGREVEAPLTLARIASFLREIRTHGT